MPQLTFKDPQPRLNPPVSCWREDMPESHEPQLVPPQLRCMTTRNDIYLEVLRYSTEVSWLMMLPLSALVVGVMFYFIFLFVSIGFYMFFLFLLLYCFHFCYSF